MRLMPIFLLAALIPFNVLAWNKLPGAAKDVGMGWVIGTDAIPGGYGIYRWNGTAWEKMPGGATRIGGSSKHPWVVNDQNLIFRWDGKAWKPIPGKATDVGAGWVIGADPAPNGFGIYRWNGQDWIKMPGSAVRIGGTRKNPWVSGKDKQIFRWDGHAWQQIRGAANDVGTGWVIGTDAVPGGFGIHHWNGDGWGTAPGGAVAIGGTGNKPWVVNNKNEIYAK